MWQGWMKCSPTPTPGSPHIPRRWRPQPQSTRNGYASQATGQTVPDAGRIMQGTTHTPGRWTRCTGLHSIPDRTRRVDHTGGGCLGAGRVRNCADADRAHRRTNVNTKKCVMLHTQLDIDTKKCYYNARNKRTLKGVTPPQNRRATL